MPKTVHRGGVIRLGSDIYLHTTGRHRPIGIEKDDIRVNGEGDLIVPLKGKASDEIVTCAITADRQLAGLGIWAGASAGPESVTVSLYRQEIGPGIVYELSSVCPRVLARHIRPDDPMLDGLKCDVWVDVHVRVQT